MARTQSAEQATFVIFSPCPWEKGYYQVVAFFEALFPLAWTNWVHISGPSYRKIWPAANNHSGHEKLKTAVMSGRNGKEEQERKENMKLEEDDERKQHEKKGKQFLKGKFF
jgi:hypothetical protein